MRRSWEGVVRRGYEKAAGLHLFPTYREEEKARAQRIIDELVQLEAKGRMLMRQGGDAGDFLDHEDQVAPLLDALAMLKKENTAAGFMVGAVIPGGHLRLTHQRLGRGGCV